MAEYILNESIEFGKWQDKKSLPEGAHISPINPQWVPKHIKDKFTTFDMYSDFNISQSDDYRFCYTQVGVIPILEKNLRKIK
jgi:hypothetical protein